MMSSSRSWGALMLGGAARAELLYVIYVMLLYVMGAECDGVSRNME